MSHEARHASDRSQTEKRTQLLPIVVMLIRFIAMGAENRFGSPPDLHKVLDATFRREEVRSEEKL
jgi:hypothetical protein